MKKTEKTKKKEIQKYVYIKYEDFDPMAIPIEE
jgi:hypothetical protein